MRRVCGARRRPLLLLAGCSFGKEKEKPAPTPSPDLTRTPAAVAVNPGPFQAGPVRAPTQGRAGRGLDQAGRADPRGPARRGRQAWRRTSAGRCSIVNTYRRFEQMVGTSSDKEFLAQGATLMVSWATGDNRSILDGEHDDLIRRQAVAIRKLHRPVLLRMRWEMDRPNLRATMWSGADYIAAWKYVREIFRAGAGQERLVGVVPDRRGVHPGRRAGLLPGRRPGRLDLRGRLRRRDLRADRRADGPVPDLGRAASQADHHRRVRGGQGVGFGRPGRLAARTPSGPSRRTRRSRRSPTSSRTRRATARPSSSS